MERQSYFEYLKEVDVIVSMPNVAFIYDEISDFINACALPKPVSLFLLQEAFHEKYPWVIDEFEQTDIDRMNLSIYSSAEIPSVQCAASFIAYLIEDNSEKEEDERMDRLSVSASRRTNGFKIPEKYKELLSELFILLTKEIELFQSEEMAKKYANVLTTPFLEFKVKEAKIKLTCKTKLFAYVLQCFRDKTGIRPQWEAFNIYQVLLSENDKVVMAGNIKQALSDIKKEGPPNRSEEVDLVIQRLEKKYPKLLH